MGCRILSEGTAILEVHRRLHVGLGCGYYPRRGMREEENEREVESQGGEREEGEGDGQGEGIKRGSAHFPLVIVGGMAGAIVFYKQGNSVMQPAVILLVH